MTMVQLFNRYAVELQWCWLGILVMYEGALNLYQNHKFILLYMYTIYIIV